MDTNATDLEWEQTKVEKLFFLREHGHWLIFIELQALHTYVTIWNKINLNLTGDNSMRPSEVHHPLSRCPYIIPNIIIFINDGSQYRKGAFVFCPLSYRHKKVHLSVLSEQTRVKAAQTQRQPSYEWYNSSDGVAVNH